MIYESIYELRQDLKSAVGVVGETVTVTDLESLRCDRIDRLARSAVFGTEAVKDYARWLIWELGQVLGARPASIHEFYVGRAKGLWSDRTVPAMNVRFTTYDTCRAAFRAAKKTNAGAIVFELARSEMSYTEQPPMEYSAMVIAAAIKEGYFHPLFIQGDHFQVKASRYKTDPDGAIQEVKDLISQAIPAGFWNIDIDTSTLVSLDPPTLAEQQYHNYRRSAELTKHVRDLEPKGVTVSLGGEIGEVGEKNSTPEELQAYMDGYVETLRAMGDCVGLSKISVQTGTSHGGIVLPDGTIKVVAVDFDTLEVMGREAWRYGAGGAVQHGASTLPEDMFHRFPAIQTLEIHLATGFMNLFLDAPEFPPRLRDSIHKFLDASAQDERKPNMTDAQFYYKTRKKALGPFKPEMWGLPSEAKEALYTALEDKFAFFFRQLNVVNTRDLVDAIVPVVECHRPKPSSGRAVGDDLGLSD